MHDFAILCGGAVCARCAAVFCFRLDGLLGSLEDSPGYTLEIGTHLRHESRVVTRPVAWDESCEECCRHIQGL